MPNLLISGIRDTINASSAVKIQICNLMTTKKHAHGWSVRTFREKLEAVLAGNIDVTIYNSNIPKGEGAKAYNTFGGQFVRIDSTPDKRYVSANLLSPVLVKKQQGDVLTRNPIRHKESALGSVIMSLIQKHD